MPINPIPDEIYFVIEKDFANELIDSLHKILCDPKVEELLAEKEHSVLIGFAHILSKKLIIGD